MDWQGILLDEPCETALDYAVKMKRLPEERMMERLLEQRDACSIDRAR
jgi:hypothetical protein